mmetsp:Transcript_1189/g.3848  ORF Transcript_1189/g.3848 Transcript_1189/m.3848 type:complete len:358 (-) Transcript_1189:622-1695(-)
MAVCGRLLRRRVPMLAGVHRHGERAGHLQGHEAAAAAGVVGHQPAVRGAERLVVHVGREDGVGDGGGDVRRAVAPAVCIGEAAVLAADVECVWPHVLRVPAELLDQAAAAGHPRGEHRLFAERPGRAGRRDERDGRPRRHLDRCAVHHRGRHRRLLLRQVAGKDAVDKGEPQEDGGGGDRRPDLQHPGGAAVLQDVPVARERGRGRGDGDHRVREQHLRRPHRVGDQAGRRHEGRRAADPGARRPVGQARQLPVYRGVRVLFFEVPAGRLWRVINWFFLYVMDGGGRVVIDGPADHRQWTNHSNESLSHEGLTPGTTRGTKTVSHGSDWTCAASPAPRQHLGPGPPQGCRRLARAAW